MVTQGVELGRGWDETFRGWTDELLLGRKYKKPAKAPASKSSWTGAEVTSRFVAEYPGKGGRQDIHGRLQGIARKTGQVMVKITGGGRSSKSIKSHFDYLSRDGELALRDQDGREIMGKEALADLGWGWKHSGPALDESGARKEAFNIVFSMPEGSDERAVYAAIKSTSETEFAGHQWVIVQHFDEPQVHAHVCVKAEGMDGQRLNPRKADLHRWRERFAYELRERGMEAEATRRKTRLQQERVDKPWEATRMEERGLPTNLKPAHADVTRVKRWNESEEKNSALFAMIIASLAASTELGDQVLAQELLRSTAERVRGKPATTERAVNSQAERA